APLRKQNQYHKPWRGSRSSGRDIVHPLSLSKREPALTARLTPPRRLRSIPCPERGRATRAFVTIASLAIRCLLYGILHGLGETARNRLLVERLIAHDCAEFLSDELRRSA